MLRTGVLVVGNYTHDTLLSPDGSEHRVLGGSAAYAGAVLHALEVPFRVVARVGGDFLYAGTAPAPAQVDPASATTAFADDYRGGARRERCTAQGPRIAPSDLGGLQAEIAIACAVAGEVLPETLRALRGRARLLLADAQGLLRAFDPDGAVRLRPLSQGPFAREVAGLDVLKAGASEAPFVDVVPDGALLVTQGGAGAELLAGPGPLTARARTCIPAFPAVERDATGAGDCFLAGLAAGLWRGLPLERAARLGAWCGARAVEAVGVPQLDAGDLPEV